MPREMLEFEDVEVLRHSEKAVLCSVDGAEVWIPKSQLSPDSDIKEDSPVGSVGTLEIPEWLANEKELG